ncbi:MAG: DUF4091 domain-containing protein [Planctomycetota bacterium]|jgi:hypothetical protein
MKFRTWLASSLERHYPATPAKTKKAMSLDVACNERFHFQVGIRQDGLDEAWMTLKANAPKGWKVRIRRVGYVPMAHLNTPVMPTDADVEGREHIPGLVPDPLFDETIIKMGRNETHTFWVTVIPSAKVRPGKHKIKLQAGRDVGPFKPLELTANVSKVKIPKRKDFPVTNWFYIDALMDRYGVQIREKRFWEILQAYLKNLSEHGQDTVYTSVFSVQLDGERTPSQLLKVKRTGKGRYSFDWSDVKRFVTLAKKADLKNFEWSHLFSQWGVEFALKVYEGQGEDGKLLWPRKTKATSRIYREFLAQFLPAFHAFLKREKLLKNSFFHVSDEPSDKHLGNYKKARALLKELAPWMKVMDAMSHVEVAKYTDMPIPSIKAAFDFLDAGMESWTYFCCGPRGAFLNRLMDTPLTKIRMTGFLLYRWPFKGFLHWGYNYWNRCQKNEVIDPFTVSDGGNWPGWPFGDTFLVYPGENGPIDSIRWETFAAGLQDYALLQSVALDRDDKLFAPLKDFQDFPKTEAWITKARKKVLF